MSRNQISEAGYFMIGGIFAKILNPKRITEERQSACCFVCHPLNTNN